MPNETNNLASVHYWQARPERVPQRFYVALCLLMSSVQDYILGQKERQSSNLNWSATLSYYSLVHGGRLLSFLALGDFPTSHSALRRLFLPSLHPSSSSCGSGNRYCFDWLSKFAKLTGSETVHAVPNEVGASREFPGKIAAYLKQIQVAGVESQLTRFGAILEAAAPLRNDSNYEALLIAHEYEHGKVTAAFERLSRHMGDAAETTLLFFVDAVSGFLRHDPCLSSSPDEYEALLHHYVHDRIRAAIRRKVGDSATIEEKLENILTRLGTQPTAAPNVRLVEQVSREMFEGKAKLIENFENRISELERATMGESGCSI
jgi:hypothetical protein